MIRQERDQLLDVGAVVVPDIEPMRPFLLLMCAQRS